MNCKMNENGYQVKYFRIEISIKFEQGFVVELSLFVNVVIYLNYEIMIIIII